MRTSESRPSQRRVQFSFAQQSANGKSIDGSCEQVAQRRVEELPPVEPVVVHDESVDAVLRGQRRLAAHHVGIRQVVPAELSRLDRLRVPVVQGRARSTFAQSVNPVPHQASFSGI